ncbi:MAG: SDR family NAD(P)-dependent oxidoreductase [Bacillota bacterium]|nr:SDR family NAD(P)-dependent oxidoreductase [Bacillota bacterium]
MTYIPFSMEDLEIFQPLTEVCYAHTVIVSKNMSMGLIKCEITLINENGEKMVCIRGLAAKLLGKKKENSEFEELIYYRPIWEKTSPRLEDIGQQMLECSMMKDLGTILLFDDTEELYENIGMLLESVGLKPERIILVKPGSCYGKESEHTYSIRPDCDEDYLKLFTVLGDEGTLPRTVLHLWSLRKGRVDYTEASDLRRFVENFDEAQDFGLYSMLYIFQSAAKVDRDLKIQCLFLFPGLLESPSLGQEALSGFARSIKTVNHRFELVNVKVDGSSKDYLSLSKIIINELVFRNNSHGAEICYCGEERYMRVIQRLEGFPGPRERKELPFRHGGVYIITGGAGGLGFIFSKYLAQNYSARLILMGRSELNEEIGRKLEEIVGLGAEVSYFQGDVSSFEQVENVIQEIKEKYGGLNGIIHSAGNARDFDIINASREEFKEALLPKIYGTMNLDMATRDENMDVFIMFSSISSQLGDFGVCNYATGNTFMDRFALLREQLVLQGKRKGRSISIGWPLWNEGGFKLDNDKGAMYFEYSGMRSIGEEAGLKAFDAILGMDFPHVIIASGDVNRINRILLQDRSHCEKAQAPDCSEAVKTIEATAAGEELMEEVLFKESEQYLKELLSKVINLPVNKIDSKAALEQYGINSVMIMELNGLMEKDFESLPRTLLFEYDNLHKLASYFVQNHPDRIRELRGLNKVEPMKVESNKSLDRQNWPSAINERFQPFRKQDARCYPEQDTQKSGEIAIIGISGRYPMAKNLDEYWKNLRSGRDCITEIPKERWDYTKYFDPEKGKKGKMYTKWGGFIEGVDQFDPLFFNLSPREAETLDPQERLFMETAWHVVEDAGYTRSALSQSRVGVFVGAMYAHYQLIGVGENENAYVNSSLMFSIANRVSYFMNFNGPSLTLDTACSSALEAVRIACQNISDGVCDMAIAGGVNLSLHPNKYIFLCQPNLLSTDGRCRSFGAGGDGYVPGEGVGAILLKPLKKAEMDGDRIYAVVKAASVNHGGKTNGYTVPNPNAQAELILDSLKKSNIDARTISYIEAHGTGTSLGDPIEITGLTKAFREYTDKTQFCSIGSAKSNIGHLEAASGVAGITKVILQMKRKEFAPSLHSRILNPNIHFESSPFYVQQELADWNKPVISENGKEMVYPRRAGISGFGAGGTNVHIILEEYESTGLPDAHADVSPCVIILSAKNENRLKEYAKDMVNFLEENTEDNVDRIPDAGVPDRLRQDISGIASQILGIEAGDVSLSEGMLELGFDPFTLAEFTDRINKKLGIGITPDIFSGNITLEFLCRTLWENCGTDLIEYHKTCSPATSSKTGISRAYRLMDIAYTLQVGREVMEERLALVAASVEELIFKLQRYILGEEQGEDLFTGNIKREGLNSGLLSEGEEGRRFIESIVNGKKLSTMARLWATGVEIDWRLLYEGKTPKRIGLPVYPFEKERCWIRTEAVASKTDTLKTDTPVMGCYRYQWEYAGTGSEDTSRGLSGNFLIFAGEEDIFEAVRQRLQVEGRDLRIICVKPGQYYKKTEGFIYEIRPECFEDYIALFKDLQMQEILPTGIIYLWSYEDRPGKISEYVGACIPGEGALESYLRMGVYSVFNILHALDEAKIKTIERIMAVYRPHKDENNPFFEALSGYTKSLKMIWPNTAFYTLELCNINNPAEAARLIKKEIQSKVDSEIKYDGSQRLMKRFFLLPETQPAEIRPKIRGTYLITGGCGSLGMIFARYLAGSYQARLVLTGRSGMDSQKKEMIKELEKLGSEVLYIKADSGSRDDMKAVVKRINDVFGELNGVIHSAGRMDDKSLLMKEKADFKAILDSKIWGTVLLDEVTKDEPLDFFVLFSSVSAILGDFGQCDYAIGNRFMDGYADLREVLQVRGKRRGRTVSINWPLWKDGGMHGNKEGESFYLQSSGMAYLETRDGIKAFEQILSCSYSKVLVMVCEKNRVSKLLGMQSENIVVSGEMGPANIGKVGARALLKNTDGIPTEKKLETEIRNIASEILRVAPERMDVKENIGNYGFDSISLKELGSKLGEIFGIEVAPTVFFAHTTIQSIGAYLLREYPEKVNLFYSYNLEKEDMVEPGSSEFSELEVLSTPGYQYKSCSLPSGKDDGNSTDVKCKEPVAIIGVYGIFPGAKNLVEFWDNLQSGKDSVIEIPPDRWDWREYFSENPSEEYKSYSKWAGFIEDIDTFDAGFYNISPREAEIMDPQQRMLIEGAWKAIEDAGYKASELSEKNVGVFIGASFNDYNKFLDHLEYIPPQIATGNAQNMLANRLSFLFNLRGPSETINTACSSSLIAIHRAVKSIRDGESEMAVAGGVNLILSPYNHILASKMGMLSPDGRCKAFDKSANGFVKGEGIGIILLKPLSRAVEDNDHIYAVIKGSAENHGGRANSLTAPNSEAQAELIKAAFEDAKIGPETVTYIETHGTGTQLGDPVEVEGLKKAFNEVYKKTGSKKPASPYCGLGSVKTNIGHLEPASGIAGLLKVVMAMKHKKLAGNLHFKEINPYLNISGTPFYIVDSAGPWKNITDDMGNIIPLRAGVSSFGFGGANAHVLLEEYREKRNGGSNRYKGPYLFVFSAKDEVRLKEHVSNMTSFLGSHTGSGDGAGDAVDIAYTLQTGREEMEERLAVVAGTVDELRSILLDYCVNQTACSGLFRGNAREGGANRPNDCLTKEGFSAGRSLEEMARIWTSGGEVDWKLLYDEGLPKHVPLPTYPFSRDRYWLPGQHLKDSLWRNTQGIPKLHPIIDRNESTLKEQKYSKRLTGSEFYMSDHIIQGRKTLPGVAYLEMVRAAGELAMESRAQKIRNVMWALPIDMEEGHVDVYVTLYPEKDSVEFEVGTTGTDKTVCAGGRITFDTGSGPLPMEERIDIEAIRTRCNVSIDTAWIYKGYKDAGLEYGPAFRTMMDLRTGDAEALSCLVLPEKVRAEFHEFVLHPSLMDGTFQTVSGMAWAEDVQSGQLYLPFALGEVEILKPLKEKCYAYVRQVRDSNAGAAGVKKFHIDIVDESGLILVKMKNFSARAFRKGIEGADMLDIFRKLQRGEMDAHEVKDLMRGAL